MYVCIYVYKCLYIYIYINVHTLYIVYIHYILYLYICVYLKETHLYLVKMSLKVEYHYETIVWNIHRQDFNNLSN